VLAALVILVCCLRRHDGNDSKNVPAPFSGLPLTKFRSYRSTVSTNKTVETRRTNSIVGPRPSATVVKACESLSFSGNNGPPPLIALSGKTQINAEAHSSGHRTFALWSDTLLSASASGHGGQPSTLATSSAPRAPSESVRVPEAGPGQDGRTGQGVSALVPTVSLGGGASGSAGINGQDELKIYTVLDRGRDSAVYEGAASLVWPVAK
jgi:hypothetical protein